MIFKSLNQFRRHSVVLLLHPVIKFIIVFWLRYCWLPVLSDGDCFRLLKRFDFEEMKFSLYFMGYEDEANIPKDDKERTYWTFKQKATIELTQ